MERYGGRVAPLLMPLVLALLQNSASGSWRNPSARWVFMHWPLCAEPCFDTIINYTRIHVQVPSSKFEWKWITKDKNTIDSRVESIQNFTFLKQCCNFLKWGWGRYSTCPTFYVALHFHFCCLFFPCNICLLCIN